MYAQGAKRKRVLARIVRLNRHSCKEYLHWRDWCHYPKPDRIGRWIASPTIARVDWLRCRARNLPPVAVEIAEEKGRLVALALTFSRSLIRQARRLASNH